MMNHRISQNQSRESGGFTLIELLTVLLIVAILLSLGAPGFTHLIRNTQVETDVQEILDSFWLARRFAANSNLHVTVCGSSGENSCDSLWEKGYIVFSHSGTASEFINNSETPILYRFTAGESFSIQGNIRKFTFRPSGLIRGKSGSILYCPNVNSEENKHRIVVSRGGRIRVYNANKLATNNYLSAMNC